MNMDEQETTVNLVRSENVVIITTFIPKHLRKLRADDRATEVVTWEDGAQFTVPTSAYDPLTGFKRRSKPLSEDQRQELADRLARARQNTTVSPS